MEQFVECSRRHLDNFSPETFCDFCFASLQADFDDPIVLVREEYPAVSQVTGALLAHTTQVIFRQIYSRNLDVADFEFRSGGFTA
jgi:hypothetical protein